MQCFSVFPPLTTINSPSPIFPHFALQITAISDTFSKATYSSSILCIFKPNSHFHFLFFFYITTNQKPDFVSFAQSSKTNNGRFSGLKRVRGGENGLLCAIKYQGEIRAYQMFPFRKKLFCPVAAAAGLSNQRTWKESLGVAKCQKVNRWWFMHTYNEH